MYSNRVCVCVWWCCCCLFFFSKFFVLSRFWSSNMVVVVLLLFFSHRISSLSLSQIPRIWKQSFWNFFLCKWLFVSFSDHSIRSSIQRIRSSIDSIRTSSVSSICCFFSLLFNFCYRVRAIKKRNISLVYCYGWDGWWVCVCIVRFLHLIKMELKLCEIKNIRLCECNRNHDVDDDLCWCILRFFWFCLFLFPSSLLINSISSSWLRSAHVQCFGWCHFWGNIVIVSTDSVELVDGSFCCWNK